jgi:crotonobetainyl-CoA:carnitine CoA-transferase CaiB-like acyl-CoA transferase
VLAVGNDGQFRRFCQLAGRPEVGTDARYADNAARIGRRDELVGEIAQWMRERTTAEWCELLEPNAVPCAPILELPQVFAHPQVAHRGLRVELDHAGRAVPMVASPMRFDGERATSDLPPPALDEHGDAIRRGAAWKPRSR